MARDRIYVNGLRLEALIGVLPEERESTQPVQVDLEIEADLSTAGQTDDLGDTANYGAIADAVAALVRASSDVLLERLATRIAACALAFGQVSAVRVTLTKLKPPIDEDIDSTAVSIRRTRVDFAVPSPHRAIVALGSNLGDRAVHLRFGLDQLANIVAQSQVFETDPVGGPDGQGAYLNMVAVVETDLDPHAFLRRLHAIESAAGRVRTEHWGPRTLDLDLLFYDEVQIAGGDLVVPHPRITERRFVLEPLSEVAPDKCPRGWRNTLPPEGLRPLGSLSGL